MLMWGQAPWVAPAQTPHTRRVLGGGGPPGSVTPQKPNPPLSPTEQSFPKRLRHEKSPSAPPPHWESRSRIRTNMVLGFVLGGREGWGGYDRNSTIWGHFSAQPGPGGAWKGPGRGHLRFAPIFSLVD